MQTAAARPAGSRDRILKAGHSAQKIDFSAEFRTIVGVATDRIASVSERERMETRALQAVRNLRVRNFDSDRRRFIRE